jgi:hypothetical protein
MRPYAADLLQTIEQAGARLARLSEEESARRPAPNKWSRKEIVGHLIDSAGNNHQRFVRARFQEDLVFPGYDQDAWVRAQRYQEARWSVLLELWRSYNAHIAHVMQSTPEEELTRLRASHNLHEIAWRTVPKSQPATLDFFMEDYVGHLHHHLEQALALP